MLGLLCKVKFSRVILVGTLCKSVGVAASFSKETGGSTYSVLQNY